MTETEAPSLARSRTSSGVLYAAIPPVTPRRTRAPFNPVRPSPTVLLLGRFRRLHLQLLVLVPIPVEHVALDRLFQGHVRHLAAEIEAGLPAQLVQPARFLGGHDDQLVLVRDVAGRKASFVVQHWTSGL